MKLVYGINVAVAILLLLACLFSFLTIQTIPVLTLFVPFLFVLNALFAIYWFLRRKRKFWLSFLSLLVGYISFGTFYAFGNDFTKTTYSDLKIMSYNVMGFNKYGWIKESNVGERIIDLIGNEDPDVICIQEHGRIWYKQLSQYPYRGETPYSVPRTIQAIFSKYPIIESGSLDLPETANNIIYADILYHTDTIRVYNVHLQSFRIVPSSKTFSENQSEKNYKRLVNTFAKQQNQVKILNKHRTASPYKSIVCGDFNNTQFSNVYRIAKQGLNDSFLEKGNGFGRTYNLLGFPMRIDYILTDPAFEILSHKNFNEKLSDHFPVMATLRLGED